MDSNNPVEFKAPNFLAAVWSTMLPGLGQLLKGRIMPGIIWAACVGVGYFTYFWPGLIIHAFCIMDAGFYKGDGSWLDLDTWPKRISFLVLIGFLLGYIVIRNYY